MRRRRRLGREGLCLQQFVVGGSVGRPTSEDQKTEKKASRKNHAPKLIRGMAFGQKDSGEFAVTSRTTPAAPQP